MHIYIERERESIWINISISNILYFSSIFVEPSPLAFHVLPIVRLNSTSESCPPFKRALKLSLWRLSAWREFIPLPVIFYEQFRHWISTADYDLVTFASMLLNVHFGKNEGFQPSPCPVARKSRSNWTRELRWWMLGSLRHAHCCHYNCMPLPVYVFASVLKGRVARALLLRMASWSVYLSSGRFNPSMKRLIGRMEYCQFSCQSCLKWCLHHGSLQISLWDYLVESNKPWSRARPKSLHQTCTLCISKTPSTRNIEQIKQQKLRSPSCWSILKNF